MSQKTEPIREPFPPRWVFLVAALMIIAGLGWNVYMQVSTTADKNTAQANSQTLAQDIQSICDTQGKLLLDDRDLCAKAVAVQEEPTEAIAPAKGEPGRPPSNDEIASAVAAYCAGGKCQGVDGNTPSPDDVVRAVAQYCGPNSCMGVPGRDAAEVTFAQLAAVVTSYCATGACTGPAGSDGLNAAPPTDAQLVSAVETYCSTGVCQGPAGLDSTVPGPAGADSTVPGPMGPEGRGIRSQYCGDKDARWAITYTDGAVQDGGKCRDTITPPIEVKP